MRKITFLVGLSALALAACGQAGPAAAPAAPTAIVEQPTAAPATIVERPTIAPTAAPSPASRPTAMPAPPATEVATPGDTATEPASPGPGSGLSVAPPPALVGAAQRQLANYLKVSVDKLSLQSANKQEWPDGSLGCPQEGLAYPQVVTPGFLLIFTDAAQSMRYEVHTGVSEAQMVLCENKRPIDLSVAADAAPTVAPGGAPAPDEAGERMGDFARAMLARELGINVADVTLVAVEETEWRDSSLGCPRPGQNYLQVITPGYKITLAAQGKRYEYHSDSARRAVRCDQP
jgi:hypothetical protein